jgi:hypothetical protein
MSLADTVVNIAEQRDAAEHALEELQQKHTVLLFAIQDVIADEIAVELSAALAVVPAGLKEEKDQDVESSQR